MAVFSWFISVTFCLYTVQAASFSDLTSVRACSTYKDCEKNECCVYARDSAMLLNGLIGKRDVFGDLLNGFVGALTNSSVPDESNSTSTDGPLVDITDPSQNSSTGATSPPAIGGGLGNILSGLLGKLGGLSDLQKQAEEANKKKKEDLAALMKHMADKNHLGNFLDNFQRPVVKRGVCKSLSQEGEACVNYLNGHVCPCGDNLDCKLNPKATFSGFGAIHGVHNLRCAAI